MRAQWFKRGVCDGAAAEALGKGVRGPLKGLRTRCNKSTAGRKTGNAAKEKRRGISRGGRVWG